MPTERERETIKGKGRGEGGGRVDTRGRDAAGRPASLCVRVRVNVAKLSLRLTTRAVVWQERRCACSQERRCACSPVSCRGQDRTGSDRDLFIVLALLLAEPVSAREEIGEQQRRRPTHPALRLFPLGYLLCRRGWPPRSRLRLRLQCVVTHTRIHTRNELEERGPKHTHAHAVKAPTRVSQCR